MRIAVACRKTGLVRAFALSISICKDGNGWNILPSGNESRTLGWTVFERRVVSGIYLGVTRVGIAASADAKSSA